MRRSSWRNEEIFFAQTFVMISRINVKRSETNEVKVVTVETQRRKIFDDDGIGIYIYFIQPTTYTMLILEFSFHMRKKKLL
jgi:hypothetical protein